MSNQSKNQRPSRWVLHRILSSALVLLGQQTAPMNAKSYMPCAYFLSILAETISLIVIPRQRLIRRSEGHG